MQLRRVRDSLDVLRNRGLNRKGIEVLVAHHSKLGRGTVATVLSSLDEIEAAYCK